MKERSPYENLIGGFLFSVRSFFISHDKYLIVGLFLCFLPIPIGGLLALIVALLGFFFQRRGLFERDEKNLILFIFILAILNMFITYYFLSSAFESVSQLLENFFNFFRDLFFYLFGKPNNYV